MNLAEHGARLNRVQHARSFKIGASIAVVAIAIGFLGWYVLAQVKAGGPATLPQIPTDTSGLSEDQLSAIQATQRTVRQIAEMRTDWTAVAMGTAIATGLALVIIWLGLGLTYLALGLVAGCVATPLILLWGGTWRFPLIPIQARSLGLFTLAMVALGASFTALVQGVRLIFASHWATLASALGVAVVVVALGWVGLQVGFVPPGPIGSLVVGILAVSAACATGVLVARAAPPPGQTFAIARLVVDEAVRMKVSLVFIVLLMLALAALPGALDAGNPLRYRVQSFLQYGSSVSYWLIGFLVVFLSVGTVAFEQRDRVIWQTMTKPVPVWRYVLGKWVGVMGVASVLLGVSMAGVFLFTEYLRQQPAQGEQAAYLPTDTREGVTEDRLILETQVLAARASVSPSLPPVDDAELETLMDQVLREREVSTGRSLVDDPRARAELDKEIRDRIARQYFSIGAEKQQQERYYFTGLSGARDKGKPLSVRFKPEFGNNNPRAEYAVTFFFGPNVAPEERAVAPEQAFTLQISPAAIDEDGRVQITVLNGRLLADGTLLANPETMVFGPGGLEISYPGGSYRVNFARAALVLLTKLGLMSMVSIFAGTFLSFSVASMVATGFFLGAEGAGFLWDSLKYYSPTNQKGEVLWHRVIADMITRPLAWAMRVFSNIDPIGALVDGRMVSWMSILLAIVVCGLVTLLAYAGAVYAMRRRELAIYSGH